jgi:hypothetical protein
MLVLSPPMFFIPLVLLERAESLIVDQYFILIQWEEFFNQLQEEWKSTTINVRLVLCMWPEADCSPGSSCHSCKLCVHDGTSFPSATGRIIQLPATDTKLFVSHYWFFWGDSCSNNVSNQMAQMGFAPSCMARTFE